MRMPHAPACGFAKRHITVARDSGIDRGNGHRLARRVVDALFGFQRLDEGAVVTDFDCADERAIVRSGCRSDAQKLEVVAADGDRFAYVDAHVALDFVSFDHRYADDENADAKVRKQHAVVGPRIGAKLGGEAALRRAAKPLAKVHKRGRENPEGKKQSQRGQCGPRPQD